MHAYLFLWINGLKAFTKPKEKLNNRFRQKSTFFFLEKYQVFERLQALTPNGKILKILEITGIINQTKLVIKLELIQIKNSAAFLSSLCRF